MMQAGDRKQGINKCWTYIPLKHTKVSMYFAIMHVDTLISMDKAN